MVPLFKNSLIVCVFNIFRESSNELVKQGPFFYPSLSTLLYYKGPNVEFLFKGGCHFSDLLSSTKVWESSANSLLANCHVHLPVIVVSG